MTSLLYIPTNRPSLRSAESYAGEAERLTQAGHPCSFVLLETREGRHVEAHRRLLAKLDGALGCAVHHFDLTGQRRFLDDLVGQAGLDDDDEALVQRCLLPEETHYSAGPSKAALFAAALGARWLHRRDSDTATLEIDGAPLDPSVLETRYLDRPLGEAPEVDPAGLDPRLPVAGVGTDYQGDAALDREAFRAMPLEILVEHERLENPGLDAQTLEARVRRKYLARDQEPYRGDHVEVDDTGRSEMGAFSVSRLHRIIPELPMPATLGSDYFVKNLGYRLGVPILYHSRRVAHTHSETAGRTAQDAAGFVDYSLKDTRFKLMKVFWRRLNQALEATVEGRSPADGLLSSQVYADCVDRALAATAAEEIAHLLDATTSLYESAAAAARQLSVGDPARFREVAIRLRQERESLARAPRLAFEDFARLTRLWPRLLAAADALHREERTPWVV